MIHFASSQNERSKERSSIAMASIMLNEKYCLHFYKKVTDIPKDYVPVGNIDWVEGFLGKTIKPDYYPEWTSSILYRNIWKTDVWPKEKDIFVKPSDKHKRFKAVLTTGTYKGKKKPPYICSDKVQFTDEWRLYVAKGKIVYCGWYSESDKEDIELQPEYIEEVQKLIPDTYCGAVDVGFITGNKLALVECNKPYSCGWYGKINEGHIYADWLYKGFKSLRG